MIQLLILVVIGLVVYLAAGEEIGRTLRPRIRNYQVKYSKFLTRSVLLPAIVFAVLALLMRDIILTPFLLAVAALETYLRVQVVMVTATAITPRMVSALVLAFRAAYQLQPAVFASMREAASKVDEPLRGLVNNMVETFFLTSSPARAFEEFRRRTDNGLLNQFLYILEMSESASNESVTEALDSFVGRLRQHEDLQRQVETGLVNITGQTSFMQVLAILVAFVVALIPSLRGVYTSSFMGRVGYMIVMSVIVGTSYVIEKQVLGLKEQIL